MFILEDLTCSSISLFTDFILDYLGILISMLYVVRHGMLNVLTLSKIATSGPARLSIGIDKIAARIQLRVCFKVRLWSKPRPRTMSLSQMNVATYRVMSK